MPNLRNRLHWLALGVAAAVTLACSSPGTDTSSSDDSGSDDDYFASFAAFEPVEHSGEGDGVIELDGITQAMVTASHDGEHYFSLSGLDENNEPTGDLLVNALGAYEGVTALGIHDLAEPVRIEVTADGSWTVTLAPLAGAPALPESGTGDGVFKYEGDAGTWHAVHTGEHYFSLSVYTGSEFEMGLLANEVGAYDGEVAVKKGPGLVVVQADGDWTITAK